MAKVILVLETTTRPRALRVRRVPMLGLQYEGQVRALRVGEVHRRVAAPCPNRLPGDLVYLVPQRPWEPGRGERRAVVPRDSLVAGAVENRQRAAFALNQERIALLDCGILEPLQPALPHVEGE